MQIFGRSRKRSLEFLDASQARVEIEAMCSRYGEINSRSEKAMAARLSGDIYVITDHPPL
jgi:hypothetical protein